MGWSMPLKGLLRWCGGKASAYRCRRLKRCRLNPGLERSAGGGDGKPAPVFLLA